MRHGREGQPVPPAGPCGTARDARRLRRGNSDAVFTILPTLAGMEEAIPGLRACCGIPSYRRWFPDRLRASPPVAALRISYPRLRTVGIPGNRLPDEMAVDCLPGLDGEYSL